jgi:hypothetical protein
VALCRIKRKSNELELNSLLYSQKTIPNYCFPDLNRLIALQKWTARKFSLAVWTIQKICAGTGQATLTYYWKLSNAKTYNVRDVICNICLHIHPKLGIWIVTNHNCIPWSFTIAIFIVFLLHSSPRTAPYAIVMCIFFSIK